MASKEFKIGRWKRQHKHKHAGESLTNSLSGFGISLSHTPFLLADKIWVIANNSPASGCACESEDPRG